MSEALAALLPLILKIGLPLVGAGLLLCIPFALKLISAGAAWLKAHSQRADDQAAIDRLDHLIETTATGMLTIAGEDLKAGKAWPVLAQDVVAAVQRMAPDAVAEAKDVLMLGEHALEDYLLHYAQAKLAGAKAAGASAAAAVTTPAQAAQVLAGAAKAVALVLCAGLLFLARPAAAQASPAPNDAPLAEPAHGCIADNGTGFALPHGVWLSDDAAIHEAQTLERLRAENGQLQLTLQIRPWLTVGLGFVAVGVGGFASWLLWGAPGGPLHVHR